MIILKKNEISVFLYCFAINDWKPRLQRQINRIYKSRLYDNCEEIFLFVTDPSGNIKNDIEEIIKPFPKIDLQYTNINYGEAYLALYKICELSKEKDRKILYFHTKGVFNKYKNFQTKEIDELKIKGVECWVEMMEYFLIDNWMDCQSKLDQNNIVGLTCNNFWWWGNFWWSKSSHIRNIPHIEKFYNGSRWSVEAWIHESSPEKEKIPYFEFRKINYDPHYSFLPKYFYMKYLNEEIKIKIINAEYGYFGEQRDEGRQIPEEQKTINVKDKLLETIGDNPKIIINPGGLSDQRDIAPGFEKSLRIKFSTNIEPEKEYVITSFGNNSFSIFY